jgi:chromosome segregation ATPase
MARELDEYHNTLGSEIQRSQTAQKRLEKVSTELTEAKEQSDGLASQLLKTAREMNESAQSCREMKERCGVLTQRNRDLEQQYTDNNNVIQDLRTTVQAEREASF